MKPAGESVAVEEGDHSWAARERLYAVRRCAGAPVMGEGGHGAK